MIISALRFILTGCPVPELPEILDVAISAADTEAALRDSGPMALARSPWRGFREPDVGDTTKQPLPGPYGGLLNGGALERPPVGGQLFVADFGENGAMTYIRENAYFLPSIYGSEIAIGDEWMPTSVPFLRFRSASYGISLEDRFGVAVFVHARFANMYAARVVIYAWGTATENRVDGTFGYLLEFSEGIGSLLLESGGDQYPFYLERVP